MKALLPLVLLLCACARTVDPAPGKGSFPHPPDYAEKDHGEDALSAGATCLGCHAVGEPGDAVAKTGAPSCRSCHGLYPHKEGFFKGSAHGDAWKDDASDCTDCHGTDGQRAPADHAAGRCTSCHSTFPHPGNWEQPDVHGDAVHARGGLGACVDCHGAAESSTPQICADCHDYPHPDGWVSPARHGAAYLASSGESCGTRCHSVEPSETGPRVACGSCHDKFPHPADWQTGHISVVQARGEGACFDCHEPGTPVGPAMPLACNASCHAGDAR